MAFGCRGTHGVSGQASGPDSASIVAWADRCSRGLVERRFDHVADQARQMQLLGDSVDNDLLRMYAALYRGNVALMTSRYDSVETDLTRALDLATRLNPSHNTFAAIYNALGIYWTDAEMDYYRGLSCFLEALRHARESSAPHSYPLTLCNVANTYNLRNDPAGLDYAVEAYRLGCASGDAFVTFAGAFSCGYMYYLLKEYDTALSYIEPILSEAPRYGAGAGVHTLYANTLRAVGRIDAARNSYREAQRHMAGSAVPNAVMADLSHASFLIDEGAPREAIPLLERSLRLLQGKKSTVFRWQLYRRLSDAYAALNDTAAAFEAYKIYHEESELIFNREHEYALTQLRIEYETEQKELEILQERARISEQRHKLQVTWFILAIVSITGVTSYLFHRKKERMYRRIIEQQYRLQQQATRLNASEDPSAPSDEPNRKTPAADNRDKELFDALERLMKVEHVYRENDLTIEKLAERLDTNRTYLSRAINQSGSSFVDYVNEYRIEEALKILSDVSDETPLKALAAQLGFNHRQTFYAAFQRAVGMPPSKYRQKLLQMHAEKRL